MRSGGLALVGLAGLAGCSQIFGLDPVVLVDAGPDGHTVDAPFPTVSLTAITPALDAFGKPTREVAFHPISPKPRVQVGLIGGELEEKTYEDDGAVRIPYEFPGRSEPWRLVYTPETGVPHEVQWHPADGAGFFVELQVAPTDRPAVPAGAKFSLIPNNAAGTAPYGGTFTKPRVYTTNAWSETANPTVAGNTVTVDYSAIGTIGIGGPKRAVSATDDILLTDYKIVTGSNNGCQASVGSAPFQVMVAANATVADAMPPAWTFQETSEWSLTPSPDPLTSFATTMGVPSADVIRYKTIALGSTGKIPLFQHAELGPPLPVPLGASMVECDMKIVNALTPMFDIKVPTFYRPNDTSLAAFGTMQYALRRDLANGPTVTIGLDATFTQPEALDTLAFAAPFNAPLPTTLTLDGTVADSKPAFSSPNTPITLAASTSPTVSLAFAQAPSSAVADLYEATLYTITSGKLVPVRTFTFGGSPLAFDRDLLVPGQFYTMELRAVVGATAAKTGDFRVWTVGQSIGRTFTQTFGR